MDRYEFASVVDDIFKECTTVDELSVRYTQLKEDLASLFRQNVVLLMTDEKGCE